MSAGEASLDLVALVGDREAARTLARTLHGSGDTWTLTSEIAEGIARVAAEAPDVVLVELTLAGNAGLAAVHHLHAVVPGTDILALTRPEGLDLAAQALALGATAALLLPLAGDDVLQALARIRTRRSERRALTRLARDQEIAARAGDLVRELGRWAAARTRRAAAEQLLGFLSEPAPSRPLVLYLPVTPGARQLQLGAAREPPEPPAPFAEDLAALAWAEQHALAAVRLETGAASQGLLLLGTAPGDRVPLAEVVERASPSVALLLALAAEREQTHVGVMKDPSSSAYTFSYFVDVAGREIDKARRHRRRFALATLGVDPDAPGAPSDGAVAIAEAVLEVVRDTDILARVDEHEFYLLLPETGGVGAHACRRRVLRRLETKCRRGLAMGVATYPHDGADLSQLLRVAKHRAESSRRSPVREMALGTLSLGELLDALLWAPTEPTHAEAPRQFELPLLDAAALAGAALHEALRGGAPRVACTDRAGSPLTATVRAVLSRADAGTAAELVALEAPEGELDALTVHAEQGAYALLGRVERGILRAVHSADPLLADLVAARLREAAGREALD